MPVFLQNVSRRPFLARINIARTKVRINLNVCIYVHSCMYTVQTHTHRPSSEKCPLQLHRTRTTSLMTTPF